MKIEQCPENLRVHLQKKLQGFRRMLLSIGIVLLIVLAVLIFGSMDDIVKGAGSVAGIREYALKSLVSARSVKICHREGDEVKRGDELIRMDDREQQNVIARIANEIKELNLEISVKEREFALLKKDPLPDYYRHTRKQLEEAREKDVRTSKELEVYSKLYEQKLVTRKEFLQAELEQISNRKTVERLEEDFSRLKQGIEDEIIAKAAGELELLRQKLASKQDDLKMEKQKLEDYIIRAPDAGVVTDIPPRAGGYYETGEVIVKLSANRSKKVIAYVDEKQIYKVAPGQKVRIYCNQYNYLDFGYFYGTVDVISQLPVMQDDVNYYPVKIVLAGEQQPLRFGSRCEVDIITGRERIISALTGIRSAKYIRSKVVGGEK